MPGHASIVIPAHNEEARIRGLLDTLADPSIRGLYDVYVVCNGCTDRTREVAEEYSGVTVVEIQDAGKFYALNEGDRLSGDVYPRLYCDADIQISPASVTALVNALTTDEIRAGGPAIHYGVERSSWAVKMYFRAHESRIMEEWVSKHLTGRGCYGVSRAGRDRYKTFPLLLADDLFFDSQFSPEEKLVVQDSVVTIWVPTDLRELVRAEVRVFGGNQQYRQAESENGKSATDVSPRRGRFELRLGSRIAALRSWARDLRSSDVVPLLWYLAVVLSARTILKVRKVRGLQIHWR